MQKAVQVFIVLMACVSNVSLASETLIKDDFSGGVNASLWDVHVDHPSETCKVEIANGKLICTAGPLNDDAWTIWNRTGVRSRQVFYPHQQSLMVEFTLSDQTPGRGARIYLTPDRNAQGKDQIDLMYVLAGEKNGELQVNLTHGGKTSQPIRIHPANTASCRFRLVVDHESVTVFRAMFGKAFERVGRFSHHWNPSDIQDGMYLFLTHSTSGWSSASQSMFDDVSVHVDYRYFVEAEDAEPKGASVVEFNPDTLQNPQHLPFISGDKYVHLAPGEKVILTLPEGVVPVGMYRVYARVFSLGGPHGLRWTFAPIESEVRTSVGEPWRWVELFTRKNPLTIPAQATLKVSLESEDEKANYDLDVLCFIPVGQTGGPPALPAEKWLTPQGKAMTFVSSVQLPATVNIRKAANRAFMDEQAGDDKGGWDDDGPNDLRNFPTGWRTLTGIPFYVIPPETNDNKSCIVLRGGRPGSNKSLPLETSPIAVNQRASYLYFLHGVSWLTENVKYAEYQIEYDDGVKVEIPLRHGVECRDWWDASSLVSNGWLGWVGDNPFHAPISMYILEWRNPHPEKIIRSLTFKRTYKDVMPKLIAVTMSERRLPHTDLNAGSGIPVCSYMARSPLSFESGEAGDLVTVRRCLPFAPLSVESLTVHVWRMVNRGGKASCTINGVTKEIQYGSEEWTSSFTFTEPEVLEYVLKHREDFRIDCRMAKGDSLVLWRYDNNPQAVFVPTGQDVANAIAEVTFEVKVRSDDPRWLRSKVIEFPEPPRPLTPALVEEVKATVTQLPAELGTNPRDELCLNGVWEVAPGEKSGPPAEGPWHGHRVPGDWSTYGCFNLPEEIKKSASLWHRTAFTVPEWWQGRRIVLNFGAVAEYCQVYLNGQLCGEHTEGLLPFDIDVTWAVQVGKENILTVYVEASALRFRKVTAQGKDYYRANHMMEFIWGSECAILSPNDRHRRAGIWQDVYLRSHPAVRISETFIIPSVRKNTLTVRSWITNETDQPQKVVVRHQVLRRGQTALELTAPLVEVKPGATHEVETVKVWKDAHRWDINDPYLYYLKSELVQKDTPMDETYTRFGFREFWIQGTDFYLNGRKIFLQGDSPTWSTPWHPDNELWTWAYRRLFYVWARGCNMNFIRNCISGMGDITSLDMADRMGMLLQPEDSALQWFSVPWPEVKECTEQEIPAMEEQLRQWVRTMRNSPSVIMYGRDNEAVVHNFAPVNDEERYRMDVIARLNKVVKAEDPTRPINHSGVQPTCKDPGFEIADYHYPPLWDVDNWQEKYKKPLILGEISFIGYWWDPSYLAAAKRSGKDYQAEYWQLMHGMAHSVRGVLGEYVKRDVAGLQPYETRRFCWHPDMPYWEGFNDIDHIYNQKIHKTLPWSALSGPGIKPDYLTPRDVSANWFDSKGSDKLRRNLVYDAFRQAWRSQPPMKPDFAPEIVVQVLIAGKPVAGCSVHVLPLENQGQGLTAVKTDGEGKAWLRLQEPGKYRVVTQAGGKVYQAEVTPSVPMEWYQVKVVKLNLQ